jgi:hypothetical protein
MSNSRRILNTLRQFGFDPIVTARALKNLPRYLNDLFKFRYLGTNEKILLAPALSDFEESSGSAKGHYFWQDLICAKWIFGNHPSVHLDLGSRIDGFICHLLPFTNVEILDIRPLSIEIPGLTSRIVDAQSGLSSTAEKYQSVSSLHSLEHFGLGRYSDPLDRKGHEKGLRNLSEAVDVGGNLYISFPIGEPRIEFNSQRIVHPLWPLEILTKFSLEEFVLIPWVDAPIYGLHPSQVDLKTEGQCGLYKLKRIR